MSGKYNVKQRVIRETGASRPYIKVATCQLCHRGFGMHETEGWKGTPAVVVETQVDWLRGNDIVDFYHPDCFDLWKQSQTKTTEG